MGTPAHCQWQGHGIQHVFSGASDLSGLLGQLVWPCRLSLPALNRLNTDFSPDDFAVVAISVDYVDEDALDFLSRYPVDYPVAIDKTGDSGRAFAVSGMPSGYLIGRDGLIREVHVGFRKGDEEALRAQIAALIAEP